MSQLVSLAGDISELLVKIIIVQGIDANDLIGNAVLAHDLYLAFLEFTPRRKFLGELFTKETSHSIHDVWDVEELNIPTRDDIDIETLPCKHEVSKHLFFIVIEIDKNITWHL